VEIMLSKYEGHTIDEEQVLGLVCYIFSRANSELLVGHAVLVSRRGVRQQR
jgi:hypothetical protein